MIAQFKTLDDELWVIDSDNLKWGRASSILSSPSVTAAAESKLAQYVFSEEGPLVPMGGGTFTLGGRKPSDGLTTVGVLFTVFEGTVVAYLQANVPVKQESFKMDPVKPDVKCVLAQRPHTPVVETAS